MISAPQNFDQLQQLLALIEARSAPVRPGAASLRSLRFMIDNPAYCAVSTMTDIARKNAVNPSTLTRLAYTLGFPRFSALQNLFREHIEQQTHFYTTRATRLIEPTASGPESSSLFDTVIHEEAKNVVSLASGSNRETQDEIVNMLVTARKVRFYGRRQFFSLAVFFAYCLGLIREGVDTMRDDIHETSHALAFMDENDLMVVLGCAPYTRATVDTCRIAGAHNIPIVAITDAHESPLARYAQHHLLIPIDSHFYSNSMAAAFAMAEALLTIAAQKKGNSTLDALKKREQIIEEFGVSLPNSPSEY